MSVVIAEALILVLMAYGGVGVLVSLAVITAMGGRIDHNFAQKGGAPIQARALIFWGVAGLWPIFLIKLIKQEKPRDA